MKRLAKLRGEHAHLSLLLRRLGEMIAADHPPFAGGLDQVRQDLQMTLIAHLQAEDWLLYPDLLDSGHPKIVAVASSFTAEMGDLARKFMDYSGRWAVRSVFDDWDVFRSETAEICVALNERIEREDRDLYPLLYELNRAA